MKFITSLTGRLIAVALALIMPTLWVSAYGAPSVGSYILGTSVDYSANPAIQYMKFKVLSANTCTVTKNASGLYDDIAELTGDLVVPSSITYDGIEYKVVELESYGFSYLTGITSATVSEGIVTLGHHSFAESENLESLSLPSTLQSVAELSSYEWQLHIYNCLKVKSITIADGNAEVSSYDGAVYSADQKTLLYIPYAKTSISFPPKVTKFQQNCGWESALESLTIPESVTAIPRSCFSRCKNLRTVTFHPGVTTIDFSAFAGCTGLTDLQLPENLVNLAEGAFSDCTSLTSVTIPDVVVRVKGEAGEAEASPFSGCTALTEIKFNPTTKMQAIPPHFYDRTGIKEVTVPEGIVKIGLYAFGENVERVHFSSTVQTLPNTDNTYFFLGDGLKEITVDESNPYFTSIDGMLMSADASRLLAYPPKKDGAEYAIPASVTEIGKSAFMNVTNLSSITGGTGISKIGEGAFSFSSLTSFAVPVGVTVIEKETFRSCKNLTSVTMTNVERIATSAFAGCSNLININNDTETPIFNFPATLKSLEAYAFENCSLVQAAELPATLEEINYGVFYNCSALADIRLNGATPHIGGSAFYGTAWLNNQTADGPVYLDNYLMKYNGTPPAAFEVSEGTVGIGAYPFTSTQAQNITSITLPESLKVICESAFSGTKITDFVIPDGVTYIGGGAFITNYGSTVNSVTFGAGLEDVGPGLFRLGLTIDKIDCSRCVNLTKVGSYIYNHNTGKLLLGIYENPQTDITFVDGVTSVDPVRLTGTDYSRVVANSLRFNKNMRPVEFSNHAEREYGNFNDIFSLGSFEVDEENPYFSSVDGVLYNKEQTILYAYPGGKTDTEVIMPETVERIGNGAFNNNETITKVTLSPNVTTLGRWSFAGCYNLTEMNLGRSLVVMEDYSMSGCDNLTSLTLPPTFAILGEMGGKSYLGNLKYLTITTVGEVTVNVSEYADDMTINYPCVTEITVEGGSNVTTNAYSGTYSDGYFEQADTYTGDTETLYFTTETSGADNENYVVVTNTPSNGDNENPDDDPGNDKKAIRFSQKAYSAQSRAGGSITATCKKLVLKDGVKLETPIAFTAENVIAQYPISTNRRTLCLPIDCEVPDNIILEVLEPENEAKVGSTSVTLNLSDSHLVAGKAYVAHIDGSPIAQFSTSNIEVQPSVEINSTLQMQSNLGDDITFDEAFRSKEENKGYKFYRYDSANDKFVECGLTDVCPTSQCYLKADDLIMTAELNVEHDNKATGIDGITEDEPVYEIYDLQGRKVTGNLSTGIYIINGKKRFVRQ